MLQKRLLNPKFVMALLALLILGGSVDTLAQRRKPALKRRTVARRVATAPSLFAVPAGTTLRVRINQTVNSKTARIGDRVTGTVVDPVYSSTGVLVIPQGSNVSGRIDSVVPAAKGGKPGSIDLHFTQIATPNGTKRVINGMLTDLAGEKTRSDNEGTVAAKGMGHRKLIFIGGGGAGGAILGAAVGGGKGALIGGLLGAAGGYLGQKLTKGPEAEVQVGTEFGVYLNQGISLPRFAEVNP
jgi:Bacterial conjugation TrbI-like protein